LDFEVAGSRSALGEKTIPLDKAQKQLEETVKKEKLKRIMNK
jgi:hypothetical protein